MRLKQREKKERSYQPKIDVYVVAVGISEYNYINNIVEENYFSKFKIKNNTNNTKVLDNYITLLQAEKSKSKNKSANEDNIIKVIKSVKNRIDNIKEKDKTFIIFITDLDYAELEQIQMLKNKIIDLYTNKFENLFFVLNKSQLEDYLKYYFDDIKIIDDCSKSHINRCLNDNWNNCFKSKHKNAKNKYFAASGYNSESQSLDYAKLDSDKDYSDFPYLFDFIKNEYKLIFE